MPSQFKSNILYQLLGGSQARSIRLKKNVLASLLIKGTSILIGLALVPLLIHYLEPTRYGIWVTLSSFIAWLGFFDVGLGHGLRNRFAEAIARGEHGLAKVYVSSTYAILSVLMGSVMLLFLLVYSFLDWNLLLNASPAVVSPRELALLGLFVVSFFCITFVLKLIGTVLTADQMPAKASLLDLLGKIVAVVVIFILSRTSSGSLLYMGMVMSGAPVFIFLVANLWFFRGRYRMYRPSFRTVDFSKTGVLLNLGVRFFILQLSAIVMYQSNNIIIAHLFGPEFVASYDVAFKYFTTLMMIFITIVTPFWTAVTDSWIRKDMDWIRRTVRRLLQIWGVLVFVGLGMLLVSEQVFLLWIGDAVQIPFTISLLMYIWVMINSWNLIFVHFLNGTGKVGLQLRFALATTVLNIPLAILLGSRIGIEGVLLASIIMSFATVLVYPLQYRRLMNGTARGVFNV
jgi:O-antigen/teichoic acid export membrane protein